jgi:hypothetical protein
MSSRFDWTDPRNKFLTTFLRSEKDNGRQAESGWKGSTWERAAAAFAGDGVVVSKTQVANHFTAVSGD